MPSSLPPALEQALLQQLDAAIAIHNQGKLAEARALYDNLLQQYPTYADALHLRGLLAYQEGHYDKALLFIQKAIQVNPVIAFYYNNLALVLAELKAMDEAIAACQTAIDFDPNCLAAYCNRGKFYYDKREFQKSIADFEHVISADSTNANAWCGLADALKDIEEWEKAKEAYQRSLALVPNRADRITNLALVHKFLGEYTQAEEYLDKAIMLEPDLAIPYYNRGSLALLSDRLDHIPQAEKALDTALKLDPAYPKSHFNKGLLALLLGQLETGFKEYEWRFKAWDLEKMILPNAPEWDGSPLDNKTLLVFDEQGLGDSLQFYRYLPLIAKQAKKVFYLNKNALSHLFKAQHNGVISVSKESEISATTIDYSCALLSLPYLMKTRLETIPANIPYLEAPEALNPEWQNLFKTDKLKVGIIWRGNPAHQFDHKRSCDFALFEPLLTIPHCQFYSLQKINNSVNLVDNPWGLIDLGPKLDSFATTAAVAGHLDLLISVDTGPVHLFGALGKPVWVLLAYLPDWRWMLNRNDSPWYPLFRLFRQKAPGEWKPVFEEVREALEKSPAASRLPPFSKEEN